MIKDKSYRSQQILFSKSTPTGYAIFKSHEVASSYPERFNSCQWVFLIFQVPSHVP